jgi:hypothetical protein
VILNVLLIPHYSIYGAAAATVASEVLWFGLSSYFFSRRVMLFAAPMVLLYVTSLAGFYDIELGPATWRFRPLVPAFGVSVPAGSVRRVETIPAYRGTWQLRIVTDAGVHVSASARRDVIDAALARVNATPAALRGR